MAPAIAVKCWQDLGEAPVVEASGETEPEPAGLSKYELSQETLHLDETSSSIAEGGKKRNP